MKALYALFYASVIVFVSCKPAKTTISEVKSEDVITLKFIQLNDVYEIAPLSGGKYGGMARVAHIADSVRAVNPNTYLFMAGDFLNPSLLGTLKVDGERVHGRQMIEVMNAMKFDLVTFGNHEFDIGLEHLEDRLNESNFQWTSANVMKVSEQGPVPFTVQKDIGNIKIPEHYSLVVSNEAGKQLSLGFFSVTVPSNPVEFIHYGDIYEEAVEAYEQLKPTSDVVIGLTHLIVDQDIILAKRLPDLPLIMGGHEHNNMLVPVGNTVIAKADANARTIYIHTLDYNTLTKELKLDSELVVVDDQVSSDPEVEAIVRSWNTVLNERITEVIENPNEIIYHAAPALDGTDETTRSRQSNLGDLITKGMAYGFNNEVDAVIVNGGSFRLDDKLEGNVTSMDIFRVLPFGGAVFKVDITGELLKEVLDYGKAAAGTGAYLQRYNITESAGGDWLIDGKPVEGGKRYYTIATSDFLMKGYDIPFLTEEHPGVLRVYKPEKNDVAYDIRKAVILYLKSLK